MQSIDSGYKYGDINDQFYRADLLFTPTDNLDVRYSYDRSEQDRKGGARAVWEIGPKSIFTLPNGVVFNTNPHAQAYENAFGILFDDHNVSSGLPGRHRRRIRNARRPRHERAAPRPRSANARRQLEHHATPSRFARSPAIASKRGA